MIISLREKIAFLLGVVFLLFSRFWLLGSIPVTLPHDELVYAIQAQSFVEQGSTLDQQQSFWSLNPVHPMYAEWPAQIMSLGFLVSDSPLFATHFVSALMGVIFPFLIAAIIHGIWKRPLLTKITWMFFVLSPLFWQMSRLGYDVWYGLWFFVLGGALFVQRDDRLTLASVPVFLLGFFQYQGLKLLMVPWMALLLALLFSVEGVGWKRSDFIKKVGQWSREHIWRLVIVGLGIALSLYFGFILLPNQSAASRLDRTIFSSAEYLSQVVNTERRLSLPSPISSLMSNKATAIGMFMLERLLGVFNPKLLLFLIEPNVSGFSVWTHGIFTWPEFLLIPVGLTGLLLAKKTRWSGVFLVLGAIGLCLPALINTQSEWYLLRSMFSYLVLGILAAWGIYFSWQHSLAKILVSIALILGVCNFSYHYWHRYPIISADWGNFDERIVARYVLLQQKQSPDKPITVYTSEPEFFFWAYILYGNLLTPETAAELAAAQQQYPPMSADSQYRFGKVTFRSDCAPAVPPASELTLIRPLHTICPEPSSELSAQNALAPEIPKPLSIVAVKDSGERFRIYGDQTCGAVANSFIHVQSLSQFDVESQDLETFCRNWIKDQSRLSL